MHKYFNLVKHVFLFDFSMDQMTLAPLLLHHRTSPSAGVCVSVCVCLTRLGHSVPVAFPISSFVFYSSIVFAYIRSPSMCKRVHSNDLFLHKAKEPYV